MTDPMLSSRSYREGLVFYDGPTDDDSAAGPDERTASPPHEHGFSLVSGRCVECGSPSSDCPRHGTNERQSEGS